MSTGKHEGALDSIGTDWILLERIKAGKQWAIAQAVALDAGTLSEFANGKAGLKAPVLRNLLRELGLKLVDKHKRCVAEDEFMRLVRSEARLRSAVVERAPQLLFEDDPE